jgi:hypothetical protein
MIIKETTAFLDLREGLCGHCPHCYAMDRFDKNHKKQEGPQDRSAVGQKICSKCNKTFTYKYNTCSGE